MVFNVLIKVYEAVGLEGKEYNMNVLNKTTVFTKIEDRSQLNSLFDNIYMLKDEYPNFENWYFDKVVPDVLRGERHIITAEIENRHAGVLILKPSENKICTLRIAPPFQHMGLGETLFKLSIQMLETKRPFITVSNLHYNEFLPLFCRHFFLVTELHFDKYVKGRFEIALNGHLD